MFWSARPKNLCFDQVRPCEIRFDRRDKKYLGFDKVPPSEIRFDRRHQNTYVSIKFDQARYVSTGATKTSKFRPSSTKRDRFRLARLQTSMFRPGSTKRDTFWPARPKHLCFDQVRSNEMFFDRHDHELDQLDQAWSGEIRFDRRDQNIYVFTKIDQARYVSTGATKTSEFQPSSTKRDVFRSARPQTSMFRLGSTKRDRFRPERPKYLCFDQVRPREIRFDRRDQNI